MARKISYLNKYLNLPPASREINVLHIHIFKLFPTLTPTQDLGSTLFFLHRNWKQSLKKLKELKILKFYKPYSLDWLWLICGNIQYKSFNHPQLGLLYMENKFYDCQILLVFLKGRLFPISNPSTTSVYFLHSQFKKKQQTIIWLFAFFLLETALFCFLQI